MAMTLESIREWHHNRASNIRAGISTGHAPTHDRMADAIEAHLTQPAQAVDVGAIPAEAVPVGEHSMLATAHPKDWAIPEGFCCTRIVDARMAYGWNEYRKALLESRALAGEQGWRAPDEMVAIGRVEMARTKQHCVLSVPVCSNAILYSRRDSVPSLPASPTPDKETQR